MYNLCKSTKCPISLSTMYRYMPKHVKLQGKIPLRQSCCEKCLNFDNVSREICKYLPGTHKVLNDTVDSILFKYTGYFPKIKCVLHQCSECGTEKLRDLLI